MPKKTLTVYCADNSSSEFQCNYDEISYCPICEHALVPQPLFGCYIEKKHRSPSAQRTWYQISILFFCPRCRGVFHVDYVATRSPGNFHEFSTIDILDVFPSSRKTTTFSECVCALSPRFVSTYNQSELAEQQSLSEICGMGYRKALEFLVKDYLCHKHPEDIAAIKKEQPGNAIKRIVDPRIQILAERATWIGNDETHYTRKHEDRDVEDMKRFIGALRHLIESELAFEDALSIPRMR